MRDSGLAHLLAISGLHVGLVAGFIFFTARGLLALIEPVALRMRIKKWAAGCALLGAAAYLLLSGMSVPTQRAFVMGVFRAARDHAGPRKPLDAPDRLGRASGACDRAREHARAELSDVLRRSDSPDSDLRGGARPLRPPGGARRSCAPPPRLRGRRVAHLPGRWHRHRPVRGLPLHRIADYGLLANLGAVPITGFWIMPWGLVALLLMPFGLEGIALAPMGWGIDAVVWIARQVAAQPGAVTLVPAMPGAALLAIAVGGLWLCLWRSRWRFLGIAGHWRRDGDRGPGTPARHLGRRRRKGDGGARRGRELWLSTRQRGRFVSNVWLRRDGQAETPTWPRDGEGEPAAGLRCDTLGCIQRRGERTIAFVRDPRAFDEDCSRADLVVSTVPAWHLCPGPETVVDRFDLWRDGSHAIWLAPDGVRVESVAESRGKRPWVARRASAQ